MNPASPRPSRAWIAAMVATAVFALTAAVAAAAIHARANRPIGEGHLFRAEAVAAATRLSAMPGAADEQLRRSRNELEIEALAIVDADGSIAAATSSNLVGQTVANTFLASAHDAERFGAVALSSAEPVFIDGVEEWPAGASFYAVIQPLGAGSSLLLYYDISQLLERRQEAAGIPPLTFQLSVASAGFVVIGAVLIYGRSRSVRRWNEFELENRILREHTMAVEANAIVVEEARAEAERAREEAEAAYALAEEKSRVRADFVLMINHELRTPLTGVVTGAELLAASDGLSAADRKEIINDMLFNGRRLQEIISQMLAVARMENRGLTVSMVPQSVWDLAELAREAHPKLEIGDSFTSLAAEVAYTDRATLRHLIASLVENAFTHGASTVRLETSMHLDRVPQARAGKAPKDPLYLKITDDGPGIDPSFLPRAFEKFEKDSFSSGTGLGLYSAQLMADAIGAGLAIDSSRLGTSLIIALPRSSRPGMEEAA